MNADVALALRGVIPILWAIVSSGVGLALYRSSEALLEQTVESDGVKKRVRLLGSVAIATIAFYGMYVATPTEILIGRPDGSKVVALVILDQIRQDNREAQADLLKLEGCNGVTNAPAECRAEIDDLRRSMDRLTTHVSSLQSR